MSLTSRPASSDDLVFARQAHHLAYRDVVVRQFGNWDEEQQDRFFEQNWNAGEFQILEHEGLPCGYAGVDILPDQIHIRELVLRPEWQRQEIGTTLLRSFLDLAAAKSIPVRLNVLKLNDARRLYARLGFQLQGITDTHVLLEWAKNGHGILETKRLLLREFDEADAAAFYLLGSDPAIIRYTGDPGGGLTSLDQAREVLRSRPLADYRKHGYGRWACVHKGSAEVIGFAGLKYLEDLNEVDIGYRLLPAYWGTGLATEASRAILDFGFAHLQLDEIIGLVDPENTASARVLEKLGMTCVGRVECWGQSVTKFVIRAGEIMDAT